MKQPRKTLDTFFSPQVPASVTPDEETGKIEHVALNKEQIRVLEMVVQEEKNVFFTGSAGMLIIPYGPSGGPCPLQYLLAESSSDLMIQALESHCYYVPLLPPSGRSMQRSQRSYR